MTEAGNTTNQKRSLSWESEREKISELLEDMNLYNKTLLELRTR